MKILKCTILSKTKTTKKLDVETKACALREAITVEEINFIKEGPLDLNLFQIYYFTKMHKQLYFNCHYFLFMLLKIESEFIDKQK